MLTWARARLYRVPAAFLTVLSALLVIAGAAAFAMPPQPEPLAGVFVPHGAAPAVTAAVPVTAPAPDAHRRHLAHLAHLRKLALEGMAADPSHAAVVSTAGYGSVQACIISRESGGNAQVVNATGHYGLYQFSYATWVAHGGNPADFGHASVAEQDQVFENTVAADGYSDWAPYDGC